MQQNTTINNFKGEILCEVGNIPISGTQQLRVLLIRDEEGREKVSAQKWWRQNTTSEWTAGKGFTLTESQSLTLGNMLLTAGNCLDNN